jgi:RNase P/RNase MRP subunit POP5
MKPARKFKKRYVGFSLKFGGAAPKYPEAKEFVHAHFLSFFGEHGISSLAFKLVRYDEKNGDGILRVERGREDDAIFCMACAKEWKGQPARLEPFSTSGSVLRAGH